MLSSEKENNYAGTAAVKELRLKKLHKGLPFMINSKTLPENQCYLEYPDGVIKLVRLSSNATEFIVVKILSATESQSVKNQFHLA